MGKLRLDNRSLGCPLRYMKVGKIGMWDLALVQVDFVYINLVYRSNTKSPFHIVNNKSLEDVIDLEK